MSVKSTFYRHLHSFVTGVSDVKKLADTNFDRNKHTENKIELSVIKWETSKWKRFVAFSANFCENLRWFFLNDDWRGESSHKKWTVICESLKFMPKLERLDIERCGLRGSCFHQFYGTFENFGKGISILNLKSNCINCVEVKSLLKSLFAGNRQRKLERLDLRDNEIGDYGMGELSKHRHNISILRILECNQLSDVGIRLYFDSYMRKSWKDFGRELNLSGTNLSGTAFLDTVVPFLADQCELFQGASSVLILENTNVFEDSLTLQLLFERLINPFYSLGNLLSLNCVGTRLDDKGITVFVKNLKYNNLKSLDLRSGNFRKNVYSIKCDEILGPMMKESNISLLSVKLRSGEPGYYRREHWNSYRIDRRLCDARLGKGEKIWKGRNEDFSNLILPPQTKWKDDRRRSFQYENEEARRMELRVEYLLDVLSSFSTRAVELRFLLREYSGILGDEMIMRATEIVPVEVSKYFKLRKRTWMVKDDKVNKIIIDHFFPSKKMLESKFEEISSFDHHRKEKLKLGRRKKKEKNNEKEKERERDWMIVLQFEKMCRRVLLFSNFSDMFDVCSGIAKGRRKSKTAFFGFSDVYYFRMAPYNDMTAGQPTYRSEQKKEVISEKTHRYFLERCEEMKREMRGNKMELQTLASKFLEKILLEKRGDEVERIGFVLEYAQTSRKEKEKVPMWIFELRIFRQSIWIWKCFGV